MRVLQSWLKKFVRFDFPPGVLAEKLGMLGLEVEKTEHLGARFNGFHVGTVLEVAKHPNADRLTICRVRMGKKTLSIVCGAPNVRTGVKVVVGLPGAIVSRNQHDPEGKPFELRRAAIRGIESDGMICSEYELGLGPDAGGILILKGPVRDGILFSKYLGLTDVAYDIEVTPNRPDWLGHLGVAREIGIISNRTVRLPQIRLKESRGQGKRVKVHIHDKNGCPRFAVRVVNGVTVAPSPEWMQRDLNALGIRPVNNVVDATNYVMMETGQPMHAFDLSCLVSAEIHIRRAGKERSIKTLDGKTVSVPADAMMVFDAQEPVSIAGIMGGADSAITEGTKDIVLEAACWNPSDIRRTVKKIGLSTDASYRFERGSDPEMIPYALNRAAEIIQQTAGGKPVRGIIDRYPGKRKPLRVNLRNRRVNDILGTDLSPSETRSLLKRLGVDVQAARGSVFICEIPSFRPDLHREIDIIEEVARVYGYDKIPEKNESLVAFSQVTGQTESAVREMLVGLGFRECITIPLVDIATAQKGTKEPVSILNPLTVEMNALRSSLVTGLLETIAGNIRHGNKDLRLFEIGHVFSRDASSSQGPVQGYAEGEKVAFCLTGLCSPPHWSQDTRQVDFFDMKGEVATLLARLSLDKGRFISYRTSDSLVEHAMSVEINGSNAGYLGSVRAEVLKSFGIDQEVIVAEFHVDSLRKRAQARYEPLPRFPRVRRDVAFIVDRNTPSARIGEVILSASSGLLTSAEVFDLYEGDRLPSGKKSLAFALEIVPREKTLTDSEIDQEVGKAVRAVEHTFGAQLRSMPGSGR